MRNRKTLKQPMAGDDGFAGVRANSPQCSLRPSVFLLRADDGELRRADTPRRSHVFQNSLSATKETLETGNVSVIEMGHTSPSERRVVRLYGAARHAQVKDQTAVLAMPVSPATREWFISHPGCAGVRT